MTTEFEFVKLRHPDLDSGPASRSLLVRTICQPAWRSIAERLGFHLVPDHFYQPVPNFTKLPEHLWKEHEDPVGVTLCAESMSLLVADFKDLVGDEWQAFRKTRADPGVMHGFFLRNGYFESVDAEMLYGFVRDRKPKRVLEIGSGFTTRLIRSAIDRNLRDHPLHDCALVSVDPFASGSLDPASGEPWQVLRHPVQSLDPESVLGLNSGDLLFIDSSHVLSTGSDVAYEFLELIPRVKPGVLVHVHDVFLPNEYPRHWVKTRRTAWNEQYILQALLTHSEAFRVVFAGQWMRVRHSEVLSKHVESFEPGKTSPGSFYFERV